MLERYPHCIMGYTPLITGSPGPVCIFSGLVSLIFPCVKIYQGPGQEFQMNIFKLSISLSWLVFNGIFRCLLNSQSRISSTQAPISLSDPPLLIYNTPLLTYSTSGLPETWPAYILRTNEEAPITERHMCNECVTPVHFASKGFNFLSWRAFIMVGGT